jgi:hypothetical protein
MADSDWDGDGAERVAKEIQADGSRGGHVPG